jgi:hypothetical protein
MIYANPGTAILEMGIKLHKRAFEESASNLSLLYQYSLGHTDRGGSDHCAKDWLKVHCDYEVNITQFRADLGQLKEKQLALIETFRSNQ